MYFKSILFVLYLQTINHEIKDTIDKCSIFKLEKQQLDGEKQDAIKLKTKLELDIKDLDDNIKEDEKMKGKGLKDLQQLENKIKTKEEALAQISPEYDEKKRIESDVQSRYILQLSIYSFNYYPYINFVR